MDIVLIRLLDSVVGKSGERAVPSLHIGFTRYGGIMAEIILLLAGFIAFGILMVTVIKRIDNYFIERYSFSIWAGAFVLFSSLLLLYIAMTAKTHVVYMLFRIIGIGLLAFVLIRNIRLSTLIMGVIAFILQFFLAISIAAIALTILARYIANRVLGKRTAFSHVQPVLTLDFMRGEPIRYYFSFLIK